MFVCMCMSIFIHVCVCVYLFMYACMYVFLFPLNLEKCILKTVREQLRIKALRYVCMCMCVYVYMSLPFPDCITPC